MDRTRFNLMHEKGGELEKRFGKQGRLPLRQLDHSIVRCENLLDFGCGKGLNANLCTNYYTIDNDPALEPNWTSLKAAYGVGLRVEGIIANQVFEHIPLEELDGVVRDLRRVATDDASILVTVPNIFRGMYFFNHIDHRTPLTYYHVGAFLEMNGFEVVDVYRYTKHHAAIVNADAETKRIMHVLENLYELDPAQFIAVVGRAV